MNGTTPKEAADQAASFRKLADHYAARGDEAKAAQYRERAARLSGLDTPEPVGQELMNQALQLYNADRGEAVLKLALANPGDRLLASMATSILLKKEELTGPSPFDAVLPVQELALKRKTARLLPLLDAPLTPEPRVHLIILSHNRRDYLENSLAQLAATDYANYKVFIADNGSNDGSAELLPEAIKAFEGKAEVVSEALPTNIGRPAGHNWLLTKYDHSDADYIAIGDDDLTYVPPTWLKRMINTARAFDKVAAVGGKALNPGRPKVIHGGVRKFERFEPNLLKLSNEGNEGDFGQFDYIDQVDHVIGCLHIYDRRALLDDVGIFDIRFSPCQLVDIEHHLRTRMKGYRIIFNGLIEFEHLRGMGKEAGRERATIGNSLGNIVKLLHKYDPAEVTAFLETQRREYAAWLAQSS